ncbi:MAG: VOC family protein [Steroidobacteraceae bacterium]
MAKTQRRAPLVTPLKRTAILVTDLPGSLRFYRDGFGMKVWVQGEAGDELPPIFRLLGLPIGRVRWVILQSGDVDWGMVGLFELTRPAPARDRHRRLDRVNRGEACLVFHSQDVAAVHRLARRLRLRVLCPPTLLPIAGHGVLSKEMTLRDPNGVLVNVIQNLRGGAIGLSNRFPGLKKPLSARRSGASSRGRSE